MNGKIQVELQDSMGSDLAIANAAWVSTYDKEKREAKYDDPEKVAKLIKQLAEGGHAVPFESVVFRFWVRMPIHTDRQFIVHRLQSANGLSGRYRTLPDDWYSVPSDVQDIFVRAGYYTIVEEFDEIMERQQELYKRALMHLKVREKEGVISNAEYKRGREIVRGVIGTASMTERTSVMNLRSWSNFQRLRNSEHAQAEIREVAQLMLAAVKKANVCPLAIAQLERMGWDL